MSSLINHINASLSSIERQIESDYQICLGEIEDIKNLNNWLLAIISAFIISIINILDLSKGEPKLGLILTVYFVVILITISSRILGYFSRERQLSIHIENFLYFELMRENKGDLLEYVKKKNLSGNDNEENEKYSMISWSILAGFVERDIFDLETVSQNNIPFLIQKILTAIQIITVLFLLVKIFMLYMP